MSSTNAAPKVQQSQGQRSMASSALKADTTGHGSPAICPTDHETVIPKREGRKTKIDNQSLEYIVKSGVAGGLAGCAVGLVLTARLNEI